MSEKSKEAIEEGIKSMGIEHLPVSSLNPYENNSRIHTPEQVKQIADSIAEFGFKLPILIDDHNTIIAGHGKHMAAQQLGLQVVPCIKDGSMTEEQRRAYVIVDNQLTLNSSWDKGILKGEVEYLQGLDFDDSLLGFNDVQMKALMSIGEGLSVPIGDGNANTKDSNTIKVVLNAEGYAEEAMSMIASIIEAHPQWQAEMTYA